MAWVAVGAVASRILGEGGGGEHDAAVREGIRVYSRRCGCLVFVKRRWGFEFCNTTVATAPVPWIDDLASQIRKGGSLPVISTKSDFCISTPSPLSSSSSASLLPPSSFLLFISNF